MWKELVEAVPGGSSVVLGVVAWAAIAYGYAGPEAASRVIEFDGHRAACETTFKNYIGRTADEALSQIRMPDDIGAKRAAINQYSALLGQGQLGAFMNHYGFNRQINEAERRMDAVEQRARSAYEAARARVKNHAQAALDGVGDRCSCVAARAIDDSRIAWALHVGTIGLVTPEKVKSIRGVMESVQNQCNPARGTS